MDLGHKKYQNGQKRGLILDDLKLYQNWLEEELLYEIKEISLDEYQFYVDGKLYNKYINCSKVSEEFLKYCFICDISFILDDGYEERGEFDVIDMEELVDEWIREGMWDWKKEVKERNSHGKMSFDMEEIKKKAIKELRIFLD